MANGNISKVNLKSMSGTDESDCGKWMQLNRFESDHFNCSLFHCSFGLYLLFAFDICTLRILKRMRHDLITWQKRPKSKCTLQEGVFSSENGKNLALAGNRKREARLALILHNLLSTLL